MRLAVLSMLCLFVSCFQEPPADRVWRCSAEQPGCPQGQSCTNDWCVKDGTATPDLAVSDAGGGGDMSKPPCTDGVPIGTKGVWGCKGRFSPTTTKASALCLNGYRTCVDGFKVTDAECSATTLKGFYFADVPAEGATGAFARCAMGGNGNGSMWYGCGWYQSQPGRASSERTNFPCKDLPLITYCDNPNLFFCSLTDLRLDAQRMDNPANGVLCCPP